MANDLIPHTAAAVEHQEPKRRKILRPGASNQANTAAANTIFERGRKRLDDDTRRRHDGDLSLFAQFLFATSSIYIDAAQPEQAEGGDQRTLARELGRQFAREAETWEDISWGMVEGFVEWQLQAGYAIGSINVRLSTVRRYARLAMQAGVITPDEFDRIAKVRGFGGKAARSVDQGRKQSRVGAKKASATRLTPDQAEQLKRQPVDTAQARRDGLLMCLLLDQGFRVGEVASLTVGAFDLGQGAVTVYRSKVDLLERHDLSRDTLEAARYYIQRDRAGAQPDEPLLLAANHLGELRAWTQEPVDPEKKRRERPATFGERSIRDRVRLLGEAIGVANLSPHDCRHDWATVAAESGTDLFVLRNAGGWRNINTPNRYVSRAATANRGVKLQRGARPEPQDEGKADT